MPYPKGTLAGVLFFTATTQFILCLIIAEALYPGYSVSSNYISDLGFDPPAIIFKSSVSFLGALLLAGTYLQRHSPTSRP
jgi:hypothetical membrane protein